MEQSSTLAARPDKSVPFATHVDDIELAENQVAKQIMVKIKFLPDSD